MLAQGQLPHWGSSAANMPGRAFPWLLIAAAPAIFAILTWNPHQTDSVTQHLTRLLAIPVVAIEAMVIAIAVLQGCRPLRIIRVAPRLIQAATAGAALIALASTAFLAEHFLGNAIYRTFVNLMHIAFVLSVVHLVGSTTDRERLSYWQWIVTGLGLFALIVALYVTAVPDPQVFNWQAFGLTLTNIRQIGPYAIVGAAAAIGIAATETRPDRCLATIGVASVMIGLAFWSGTRGAPIALMSALVVGVILVPALRNLRVGGVVLTSFAVGALLSLVHRPPSPLYGILRMADSASVQTLNELGSGRVAIWLETLRLIGERPFFGYGESQFRYVAEAALGYFNHPHNVVLQIVFQWGLSGGLCIAVLGFWSGYRVLDASRSSQDRSLPPALLVAVSLLVLSLYDGALYYPYPTMMFLLAVTMICAAPVQAEDQPTCSGGRYSAL